MKHSVFKTSVAILFAVMASLVLSILAQPAETVPEILPLWPAQAPVGDGQTEKTSAAITVHRPARPNGTAIIICPGGGYGGLVTGPEGHGIAQWLNTNGITGVVLEYRLPAGRPFVPLLDAQRAIRITRASAKTWGLNPSRIGIMGFSAGGHLASTAGTHFDAGDSKADDAVARSSCRPDFMILIYPVITMGAKTHEGSKLNLLGRDPKGDLVELFSNEKQATDRTPPAFLAHAKDDSLVTPDNSRDFYAALQAHHVDSKYLELPSGGHGLNGYQGPMWAAWQSGSLEWLAAVVAPASSALEAGAASTTALGSATFRPSSERPIGWRGDGSGRYPAATPPLSWERKSNGAGYATKNIIWMPPLPNAGVSTPIIVGEKVFLTTEVFDLVCLDKHTGRILWIRSNPEFEGISSAERAENPAYAEKLMPLLPQLTSANADAVEALNAQMPSAPTAPPAKPVAALAKKRALEKQLHDQQLAIDKKKFDRYWGQAVFGFSGPTPTSDGKRVCAFFTTGVTACYDLDGNRQWIHHGHGGGSEHGNFASPLLCQNRLVVWANEMRGYDVESGELLWTNPETGQNTYGSLFRVQAGHEWVAAFQSGYFARLSDGKPIWGERVFGDSVVTPIVDGGLLFAVVGYPRNNNEAQGFRAFRIPEAAETNRLVPAFIFKTDWADDEIPADKQKTPFNRGYVASPLWVDGSIYRMTQGAGLIVNDAATGELIYRKVLPLKPRTQYWDWAGAAASPTLAGKHIYLMDNRGTTVVIEPGKQYKEVAINVLEESKDGKSQAQNVATPIFEGARMYYRTPGFLYCIGEP